MYTNNCQLSADLIVTAPILCVSRRAGGGGLSKTILTLYFQDVVKDMPLYADLNSMELGFSLNPDQEATNEHSPTRNNA